jgi:riboflavin kinase / FMN adenylyltransferase
LQTAQLRNFASLFMEVYHGADGLPYFKNAILTIGTFDGVHTGHRQIITQMQDEAKRVDGETVIITFHPHPRKVIGKAVALLNTLDEKIELLDATGIDHLVVIPFTDEFANQSADDYVRNFLVAKFKPHTLIIGYDHQFGKGRQGNFQLLEKFAAEHFFHLIEIPGHVLDAAAVSSTRIRQALLDAAVPLANSLLGYPYFFEGTVVEGNKLGRTIGYPTANIKVSDEEKLVPANGVYAVRVYLDKGRFDGMMNIGLRPTVGGTSRTIEVNIFDFDVEIYSQPVHVEIIAHLRTEQKFDGLRALTEQLARDSMHARAVLSDQVN